MALDTKNTHQPRPPIRVLYSFPHKLGASRICHTAWQHVNALAEVGADLLVFPGVLHRPLPSNVRVRPTLARGKVRIPYRLLGKVRALALHDFIVSRRIERLVGQIDVVHTWPVGALRTLKAAARLGIPTVLERPNAHTRFAYEAVRAECDRIGVPLPPEHEHSFNPQILRIEEEEYELAYRLLCPSDFVVKTFLDKGFPPEKLIRHQYGFDDRVFFPGKQADTQSRGLNLLFVGGCAPRKGLHYALEAWLQSPAHNSGQFRIAGSFVPGYAEKLASFLAHPSVRVLGHRNDVPELMRQSDALVLPTIEEGSALVTSEARASGCVLLVSEASGAYCRHMENALLHSVGDVKTLIAHITLLHEDRSLLESLRAASLRTVHEITWKAAGVRLLQAYLQAIEARS
jgi:glycosyltransferase involved in cell wall biosynthesis